MSRSPILRAALAAILCAACGAAPATVPTRGPSPGTEASASSLGPSLRVGGARLSLDIEPADRTCSDRELTTWTRRAAMMVAEYCGGGYPVRELDVRIVDGGGLGWGQHWHGRRLRVVVGRDTSARALERDWVMVHEMLHLAFPDLARRHRWMREGLSTYLETVLRARAGIYTEEEVWSHWVRMMPNGVPRPSDQGFDHTRSWGTLYWGGALFWMLVDAEIRARTDNERSIRDVVRGALAQGGNARVRWSTERVAEVADEATGTSVVSELYEQLATQHADVDLDDFFVRLGVTTTNDGIVFDQSAPLAGVRRAMSAREGPELPPIGR